MEKLILVTKDELDKKLRLNFSSRANCDETLLRELLRQTTAIMTTTMSPKRERSKQLLELL